MARDIVVNYRGAVSRFGLARVDRQKLYGSKKRVVVDQNDEECSVALLTQDGSVLIPTGGYAMLYVDEAGDVVERSELVAVDDGGDVLPQLSTTLDVEQPLEGPVDPSEVLDLITEAVYQLDAAELDPALAEALAAGHVFKTRFVYRESLEPPTAFLLQNDAGIFALVGQPTDFEMIQRQFFQPAEDADEDDAFADDFDFSMM